MMSLKEFDANSGHAADTVTVDGAPAVAVTFDHLRLDLLVTSNTNPRTSFDQVKLQELAASIAALDVHQPILVRPIPPQRLADTAFATDASQLLLKDWPHLAKAGRYPRPTHEIVSGERRYRASIMAGKRDIPAMIRQMTDQQVLEAQLVENLQRDDLHPMEEAQGYRRLCETTGITKEEVGAKIGKSRSYVYQRLHLLQLGQEARQAFLDGSIDSSKALLLAGVADPKLQLKALKEVTTQRAGWPAMSVRDFRGWLELNVMLKLERAPFDTQDFMLIEAAGSCASCPKRTGANRDIFEAFESPDMCTDAKCYGQKASITLQRIKDAAADKGMTVIAGVEAKKLRPSPWNDTIQGYTRLDDKIEGGTVAKVLGKDAPTPMLFVDPHTHKQIKVLPTAVVGELLKTKGVETAKTKAVDQDKKWEEDRRKRDLEARIETTWRARAASQIVNQVRAGAVAAFSGPVLRLILTDMMDALREDYDSAERCERLLPLWGLPAVADGYDPTEPAYRHVQAAEELELGPMLIALLLSGEMDYTKINCRGAGDLPAFKQLATEASVDIVAIAAEVKAEIKAEETAERKAAKAKEVAAKPAKASGATPLAAQATEGAEGEPAAPAAGKKAGGKAAKLSTEDAKAGIAEAMQGHDGPGGEVQAFMEVSGDGGGTALPAIPTELGVGVLVRVNDTVTAKHLKKWINRSGKITAKQGDRAWFVQLNKNARIAFDGTELDIVNNAAAQAWPFPTSATAGAAS
jgi:ParB/RepB/Spo0J family partition protein